MIKNFCKILKLLIFILYIASLSYFAYHLIKLNIIPNKYIIIGYIICILMSLILLLVVSKIVKIINLIILIFLIGIFYKGSDYFTNTYNFLKDMEVSNVVNNYSLVVLKDSNYNNLEALNNKTIGYLEEHQKYINNNIKKKIEYQEEINSDINELKTKFINKEIDALCILDNYLSLIEEDEELKKEVKVIYSFQMEEEMVSIEEAPNLNNPFILYISGIDQYGDIQNIKSRSDVNILAVINPLEHQILLVNTPRDYYVQIAGTTGLKDKLTHVGVYGIEKSVKTLENLYDIDINYYLRVNFDTLIKIVDVIGGIDIYSDTAFEAWTNKKVVIKKGWNHFNGEQALAYARERKTYKTGDNHRGQNQQQIITAIIDKISKSSVLISKYNSILTSLKGSFQTNMKMEILTNFIKENIINLGNWKIESIQVTGYDSKNYTYSNNKSMSYVMEPNMESVNKAKEQINNLLTN